jgi:hypothetical protein
MREEDDEETDAKQLEFQEFDASGGDFNFGSYCGSAGMEPGANRR